MRPTTALAELEDLRFEPTGQKRVELLRSLERERLPSARAVLRLHEVLCFLRAYPGDAAELALVESMLAGFAGRRDLRRWRGELIDTGIAGTRIYFRFFFETACWLVRRWPDRLHVDWADFEGADALLERLPLLVSYCETPGLDEEPLSARQWVDRMKGPDETDAAFLVRRFAALKVGGPMRQALYEEQDFPLRLEPGEETPSRTRAHTNVAGARRVYRTGLLARGRPDLAKEARRPPLLVRPVSAKEGREIIELALASMVTRSRDLDVFAYGDPRDVRILDCGDGLSFAAVGFRPERRLLLEAVYGFLTLKNGVPIGYVLNSALFGSAEIAFNVFETYRGAEAGLVYGRAVGSVRALFHSDSFTIYPYQLGDHNPEALQSGAWWFYQKLGFRPRDPDALAVMKEELRRMKKNRRWRSSIATLRQLAPHNVYYHLGRKRDDVIGELRTSAVGLRVTDYLAARFGSDRERGERVCAREAAKRFGVRSTARWSAGEKLAWSRWGPLLMLLRDVEKWTAAERSAAVRVVRAKGGLRESDFALLFDAHQPLRREIRRLAREF